MIAIIQTASKAAKATNETQAKKAPNGRLQEPYRPIAKVDNAKPVQREQGKMVLNKDIPKHSNLQFVSPRSRERGATEKEGHRDTQSRHE